MFHLRDNFSKIYRNTEIPLFCFKEHKRCQFLYMQFITCTYVMLAVEGIEPSALRLKAQRLAYELSASTNKNLTLFRQSCCKYIEPPCG